MKKFVLLIIIFIAFFFNVSFTQNFWHQTNGPFGGAQVNDFLYYGDSTIFLATPEGLIKSTDNGNNWERIPAVLKYFYSIDMDSVKNLYATATDEASNPYLYKSINGGIDWVKINNNFWADFRDVMVYYKDTVIVGTWGNGLYKTTDGGLSWMQINNGLDYLQIYRILLLNNGDLLVALSGGGIYRSSDWGNLWQLSNNGLPQNSNGYISVYSLLEIEPGKILCGTQNGLYYSSDNGNNWFYRSIGVGNKHANDLTMDKNHIIFAGTGLNGVFMSTNEGTNWNYIGLNYSIYTLGWDADSSLCAGGLSYGLNRYSFEDSSWTLIYNKGYTPVETDILTLTQSEYLLAATYWWGLFKSTNYGLSWEKTGFNGIVYNIASINDTIIVLGQYNGVFLSEDSGNTWISIFNYGVNSLFYDTLSQTIYIGTDTNIYSSDDLGQSWELVHDFELNCYRSNAIITIFNSIKDNYLFATTACVNQNYSVSYKFYRSTDRGQTWQIKYSENVFEIKENSYGDLYARSYAKLLISHDGGSTWIIRNIQASCLAVDTLDRIFYGYGGTVKASDKEAFVWTAVGNYIANGINDMVISSENHIYLATDEGVYFGDLNNFVLSTEENPGEIATLSLSQNYPNPFNPTTKIKYQIPELSNVKLTVYDVLGREVRTLVNEEKPAGSYEVEFNGTDVSSGIYFYRIETAKYSDTKKFVLMK